MERKKILVIDDDEDLIASFKVVLESKGHEVFFATTKEAGFEEVKKNTYDLIILDVMMEKMCDGFDLARGIKSDKNIKNIPILMATAIEEKTGFSFSEAAGDETWLPVDMYLTKPVNTDELIASVEKLLS